MNEIFICLILYCCSFDIALTVAVVEAMEALPSPEAIQLVQSTLEDPRILQLSPTPDNVSLAGILGNNAVLLACFIHF